MTDEILFGPRMGATDSLFWRLERDPTLRSTTAAVTLLERAPDRHALRSKLERASRTIPRLRQHVVESVIEAAPARWAEDPHFDLDYHLRWMGVPRNGSLRSVLDLAATLSMQGFDRSRPLWEFSVIEGLPDGRVAVVQKLHHSVTDGIAGLMLMQSVYDTDEGLQTPGAEPEGNRARRSGPPDPGAGPRFCRGRQLDISLRAARAAMHGALHPVESTRGALRELGSLAHVLSPALSPAGPLLRKRSSRFRFETLSVPLRRLKEAARAADCKLNDAFIAALAGGWRLYHDHHGVSADRLRMAMPVSVRAKEGRQMAGNRLVVARFPVPLSISDPKERMRRIRAASERERAQPGLRHMDTVYAALCLVPTVILTQIFGAMLKGTDFIASCVPAVPETLYIAGARVESLHAFGPTGGTSANLTLFGYREDACITINADPAAIPDPEVLLRCMREGFDDVTSV